MENLICSFGMFIFALKLVQGSFNPGFIRRGDICCFYLPDVDKGDSS